MRIKQGDIPFKLPGSDSPLKKSISVTAIIHGSQSKPTNHYYIDSLQRFRRDHASVDRQQRDLKYQKQAEVRARKRSIAIERDLSTKKLQQTNFLKLRERQSYSLQQHSQGSKLTIHSYGTPIDPVNLRYQDTQNGRRLQRSDSEHHVDTLVRAHKLQTWGSSGYNIINGQRNLSVEELVPQQNFGLFQQKLSGYYEKFRIKLN